MLPLPGAHRILFSGKQPESCELLRQFVVLEPGKRYSLRWEARTQGFGSPTGIEWNAGVDPRRGRTGAGLARRQSWSSRRRPR